MADIDTLLNGNIIGAKSGSYFFDLIPRRGLVAVDYEEKLESDDVYDDHKDGGAVGETSGKYSIDGMSITFLASAWNCMGPKIGLMQQLVAKALLRGETGYGAARFSFVAEYSEPMAPMSTIVDSISNCRIVGVKDSYAEGIEKKVVVVAMKSSGRLTRNGATLYSPTRNLF